MLEKLGYPATPYDPGQAAEVMDREGRRLILCLAVAAFGAMNTMMFSVPLWAGLFGQELGPATRGGHAVVVRAGRHPLRPLRGAGRSSNPPGARSRSAAPTWTCRSPSGVLLTLAISFSETLLRGRDAYFDAAVSCSSCC